MIADFLLFAKRVTLGHQPDMELEQLMRNPEVADRVAAAVEALLLEQVAQQVVHSMLRSTLEVPKMS